MKLQTVTHFFGIFLLKVEKLTHQHNFGKTTPNVISSCEQQINLLFYLG